MSHVRDYYQGRKSVSDNNNNRCLSRLFNVSSVTTFEWKVALTHAVSYSPDQYDMATEVFITINDLGNVACSYVEADNTAATEIPLDHIRKAFRRMSSSFKLPMN
ncbi:hypothetical protein BDV40DRAFT_300167 [Aspergillus tamarii]|uniref:Uncharacterized protein n=1 Tax=Aspergillus tamarii TaxID=41984 RepID=A0A5N6UVS7_ASPTM|nr:hypothetical protein BDV40DRAFT_300167 [Aspergillus tamarii]